MDIIQILDAYSCEYHLSGKNISSGWVGVCCPFCGDSGFHGGLTLKPPIRYSCWKCSSKNTAYALSKILRIPSAESNNLLSQEIEEKEKETNNIHTEPFHFPDFCGKMKERHKKYLEARGFDPDYLEQKYSLMGTSHLGDYCHRIIIPIFYKGEAVSYQGRDITGKSKMRYKACEKPIEIIHHKNLLYNIDKAKGKTVVVTEGVTGVWKLGDNSVCTFGIQYTAKQAELLSHFKKVFVFFDNDDNAQMQSEKLRVFLNTFKVKTINLTTDDGKDSGEIDKETAKEIMKNIK